MLEHYSHIRVAAKPAAIEALETRNYAAYYQKSPQLAAITEVAEQSQQKSYRIG